MCSPPSIWPSLQSFVLKKRLRLTLPLSHSVINFGSLIHLLKGRLPPSPHIFQLRVTFPFVRSPSYQNRLSGLSLFKISRNPLASFPVSFSPFFSQQKRDCKWLPRLRPLCISLTPPFSATPKSHCLGPMGGAVVGSWGVLLLPPLAVALLVKPK